MNQRVIRILFSLTLIIALVAALILLSDRPGANYLIPGFCLIFLVFVFPLLFLAKPGKPTLGRDIFIGVMAFGSFFSLGLGLVFKIQHWPGDNYLIVFGSLLLTLSLLSGLIFLIRSRTNKTGPYISPVLLLLPGLIVFLFVYGKITENEIDLSRKSVQASASPNFKAIAKPFSESGSDGSEDAMKVHAATLKMVDFIQAYKDHLIMETEGIRHDMLDEFYARQMFTHGDDFETPTRILIGDPTSPGTGPYSAHLLKKGIEQYRDFLCEIADDHACEEVSKILDPENKKARKKYNDSWEMHNFYELPLAAVVQKLSNLQMTILSCEAVAITGIKTEDIASEE